MVFFMLQSIVFIKVLVYLSMYNIHCEFAKSQEEAQKVHAERQRQSQIELERIRNLKTKALLNKPF